MPRPPFLRSPRFRSSWNHSVVGTVCVWLLSLSCSAEITAPTPADTGVNRPELEAIPFDLIGSGRLMFQRIDNATGRATTYLVEADTRSTSTVLEMRHPFRYPSLSPGGDAVAVVQGLGGCWNVYTYNLRGGPRRLSGNSDFMCNSEGPPSWTPDGSAVLFAALTNLLPSTSGIASGAFGIFQRELLSNALTALRTFRPDSAGAYMFSCPMTGGEFSVSGRLGVALFCDGKLYVATTPSDSFVSHYRKDPVPQVQTKAPAWSPSGKEIAFLEVRRSVTDYPSSSTILSTTVKVLGLTSGKVRSVAVVPGSGGGMWWNTKEASLCWLPGEDRLVFAAPGIGVTGDEPPRANLYVVGADGTGLVKLTTAPNVFDHDVSCSR